jgi:hypothetical protein
MWIGVDFYTATSQQTERRHAAPDGKAIENDGASKNAAYA